MSYASGYFRLLCFLLLVLVLPDSPEGAFGGSPAAPASDRSSPESLNDILQYISQGWDRLTRSLDRCGTFQDVKATGQEILYLPAGMATPPAVEALRKQCGVRVEHLAAKVTAANAVALSRSEPGLLYLENPYVVPGGQFNEMYDWDSYFIILGLLEDHRLAMAKGIVENFEFEIEHYGGVLNANRTYYLTRSQPPFLSSMILAVFKAERAEGHADLAWLERAYQAAVKDYQRWNLSPHLAGNTGLSRYFDLGDGPVPEIEGDPTEYYRDVARYFLLHGGPNGASLVRVPEPGGAAHVGPVFSIFACAHPDSPTGCGAPAQVALTADYYKGDRSMRESGFDETFRFGPFGAETHHYAPVGLNSLLYKTEKDLEEISTLLGRDDASAWGAKARDRRQRMVKYMWDEQRGLFFDYNFMTGKRSSFEYATTYYPLWAGLASKQEAAALERNLDLFEQPGGLAMSRTNSGEQWDYPYGWAPIHLLAVEGLRNYGYADDANRIALKFLGTILRNFRSDHTLREKYNVFKGSEETHIEAGYKQNVIGFGWTNGVFLALLRQLPPDMIGRLNAESQPPK